MKRNHDDLTKKVGNAQKFTKFNGDFYIATSYEWYVCIVKLKISEYDVVHLGVRWKWF